MEFKIQKNEFLRGLYLASGIADRKSTLPILANVLLRTEGKDKLLCAATDLSVTTTVAPTRRGDKTAGTVTVRSVGPLGLAARQAQTEADQVDARLTPPASSEPLQHQDSRADLPPSTITSPGSGTH